MAESDFNDLLNAAEQLASEVEGTGNLPRVERTLRQVLEASQDLWTRVTTTGAQEIQANLLLGSKGVDLPQLSQKLESLSTKKTFEPLEPIPDTDIESFLKNETENAILSLIDSTHTDTIERLRAEHKADIAYEWEMEKMKLMSSMLGKDGKEYLDIPLVQEKTVLNESVFGTKSFLSSDEMRYARTVIEYHQSVMEDGMKPNLIEKFSQVAEHFNDKMVNEMWRIVKYMTQIPPQGKGDPMDARQMPAVKIRMISQARSYLENRYRLYMKSVVQTNVRKAQRGGEPGTISLVKSFIGIRLPRESQEFSQVCPIWPLIYYCLRCGDISAALRCAQKDGIVEEICNALEELEGSSQRKVSPKLEKFIRTHYKRRFRNDSNPYMRVIYCILGGCDVNDEHSEIVKTADDYLWLKLNQVHAEEEEVNDKTDGSESLSYSLLQTLVIEEYGEGHYNASEQPHVYFQLLFLTGQWEAAIDFLMRNDKLRVHGVHIAVVLHDQDLLALPVDVTSQLLVVDPKDPKPMHRLNFARLIMIYAHKFENQDLLEALHYYFCLRTLKTVDGVNVFAVCVSELVMKTRQFEMILGRLELDGCRSPGLIDQFRGGNRIDVDLVVDRVAQTAELTGQYEDAIKLYDLAGKHDEVLRLMSTMLCQVVSRIENEPNSLRSRLAAYADNITNRYSGVQLKCERGTQATFYTLRDLLKFFDYYAQKLYPEALGIIQRSRLIPLSLDEVDEKLRNFQTLDETICRNIPDVLLATMNMLYAQYSKLKGESQSTSRTYFADSLKEQLSFLRERAKAITSFAGTVPYRMPGDTNSRLVQMEILMH